MKRRICFAGFDERELTALRPALAASVASWDCTFTTDGASTLAEMAKASFDALVANLSPTGISAPELLQEAAVMHPRCLRFVLGDLADREATVNTMGAAHQFISRPWKPGELVTIVERSFSLDSWLSNDKLRAFVPRLGKLPGLPSTYFEVLKRAESSNSSVENIAEVIARDPALTARLLQIVNSPACGLSEIITSPAEAVSTLGLETVKSIVLCLQLFSRSEPAKAGGIPLDSLWNHSFRVAKLASKIVVKCIGSQRMAGEAYTAGLLHNIGQIVLATNLAGEYSAIVEAARERKRPLPDMEMEKLGVTSNHIGAYLLGLWGMPLGMVEAAALHHVPAKSAMAEFSLLTVVHVGNVLAYEENNPWKDIPAPKLDIEYLGSLELPQKAKEWQKLLAATPKIEPVVEKRAAKSPRPAPIDEEEKHRPYGKFLAFGAFAAVVITLVVMREKVMPAVQTVTSMVQGMAAPAAPAKTNLAVVVSAPVASPFDSIKLQAIIYSPKHPVTLINGKTLDVGERVNGVQVVSIQPSNVVLACNGEQKTVQLK